MKKMIQALAVLVAGAGVLGVSSVTASANSQYSAKRSKSVRLVWRKSMKRHAFQATTGARYSKHLGIRYSNNDVTPTVTWYTDAHEKLYKKNKGHNAIYYHVKSADGTLQGWIWRGYLKTPKKAATPTVDTSADSGKTVDDIAMTRYLFPNSIYDAKLHNAANNFLSTDEFSAVSDMRDNMSSQVAFFTPFKTTKYIDFQSKDPNSLKSIDAALTAAGYDAKTRSTTYSGWYVGGSLVSLDSSYEGIEPGEGIIYLIQK
ncbi:hypothetical protein ACFQET_05770 [Levilactobacillus tangyuanensis]|uniref:D-alanyl-D-alanine carboxypeptidase n=1 Tax=Levilactobacillus tangyuanensis TaxID=2486021 RepID=A0ABW1TPK1_9LACO|nr:hypothetical protein [Levilactobacillus tangyuanensis]